MGKLHDTLSQFLDDREVDDTSPEGRREKALKKALENTTPDHAGVPWHDEWEKKGSSDPEMI